MSTQIEPFGKYMLLEKLATGGMAEVYLAKAPGAQGVSRFVAIKRILPQFSQNEEFVEMFKEEAKIVVNLNHSNIVAIYEFGEEQKQFFLSMEFVQGKNLRQIINHLKKTQEKLTIDQCLYVINEVARGLDYAHKAIDRTTGQQLNIIHRDISPQNVMISYDGEVKLVDFGIAKAESKIENTKAGTLKGKFGYMSPEQAEGADLDHRTDIFSLGIVLWELLANERLFVASNELNTLKKIRDCQIPSLSKLNPAIPQELERIVNKSLTRNRNLRYQSCGELHKDLNLFLNRHYPGFSSQDFSNFVKKIYHHEVESMRKNLVEYAKIPFASTEKTTIVSEHTRTITHTSGNKTPVLDRDKLRNISKSSEEKLAENVDFRDAKVDSLELQKEAFSSGKKTQITRTNTRTGSRSGTGISYPSNTGISYLPTKTKINTINYLKIAMFMMAVSFIGLLGWYGYTHQDKVELLVATVKGLEQAYIEKSSTSGANQQVRNQTSTVSSQVNFYVTSYPSGATILVNNEVKGQTPNTIYVPSRTPVKISLFKDGYLPYEKEMTITENAQKLEATLQQQQQSVAYLSIDAFPRGANMQVFINGEKLSEAIPVEKYAVAPNKELKVRVYNPITNAEAETLVVVPAGRQQSVSLQLKVR